MFSIILPSLAIYLGEFVDENDPNYSTWLGPPSPLFPTPSNASINGGENAYLWIFQCRFISPLGVCAVTPSLCSCAGVISAAHPFGQLIGSPFAGFYFSKRPVRECMTVFLAVFCVGAMMYATAGSALTLLLARLIQVRGVRM